MSERRGIALLIVVALLGALSVTAAMAALSARISTSHAFADLERLQLEAAIDSAVARTAARLSYDELDWFADGRLYEMRVDDITVRIRAIAESGRFDLNQGDVPVLAALLEARGVSSISARRIAGAVTDWRDGDDVVAESGAEAAAYRAEGLPAPGNRPFLAVAEFRNVLGVDEAIYEAVEPYLTVHGGEAIAVNLAPPALIEAAGISAGDARRILAARRRNRPPPTLDNGIETQPGQPGIYAFYIEAEAPNRAQRARQVIVSLPGETSLYDTLSRHSHVMGYADFLDPEPEN
ncbi:general secretion pathway protein GspK [Hyphobacterium sp.]|uniref:general secretion pathway protein GspK n=1 Tax=Hyphobacterium sp. TaxID=2004662 RepID=UPI003B5231EF